MRLRHESLTDFIRENRSGKIHEAILSLLSLHISDLLNGFDPTTLKRELAADPATFLRLLNSISRLARLGLQCEFRHEQAVEREASGQRFQSALRGAGIIK